MNVTGDANHPLFDRTLVAAPTTSNHMIYYLVNNGNVANSVQPWNSANTYADDELCHEGYTGLGLTAVAPEVRCTPTDLATSTYVKYTSMLPFAGTTAALPYKWVRITPKLNGSVTYLQPTPGQRIKPRRHVHGESPSPSSGREPGSRAKRPSPYPSMRRP